MKGVMDVSYDIRHRFESLYDAHRLHVLAYCARRVSAADASDACAETFLVAWRRIDDVPGPPKALPYLYGVAAKVLANQRRSAHRRARLHEQLDALGAVPPPDPCSVLVQTDQDRRVLAAVRRLKPRDREIVMLHAWEQLPHEVIAQMLGMTKAAVDQRIHRSYERLARTLGVTDAPNTTPPLEMEAPA